MVSDQVELSVLTTAMILYVENLRELTLTIFTTSELRELHGSYTHGPEY